MIDALKNELYEAFNDEDYVSALTDMLSEQLIKSLKKAAKAEIEALKRKILKNRSKIIAGGILAIAIIVNRKRG